MSRFKIGEKVVCVKSHSQNKVVKGKIYTVKGLRKFCSCMTTIDVGINRVHKYSICSSCRTKALNNTYSWWINESLFAPLKSDMTSKELTLEIEEFELETIEYN